MTKPAPAPTGGSAGPSTLRGPPECTVRDGRQRGVGWFCAFVLLAWFLAAGCASDPGPTTTPPAPAFTLEDTSGNLVSLEDFRGKVVMLHFWATWCAPCRAQMSHDIRMQKDYGPLGLVVLGLNMDKHRQDVFKFLERNPVNYPVLFLDEETRAAFGGVSNVPLTIIIDRGGRIRRKAMGYTLQLVSSLERTIETLLEEDSRLPYGS